MGFSEEKIKLYQIEDILFENIKQTPTTLAGYGITDGLSIITADERYVRYNGAQSLTEQQKQQARENIGALGGESHPPVSIGVANGLGLVPSTQVLSLALATTSEPGAMSATDKIKLDGIANNANNYVHPTQGILDTGNLTGKNVVSRIQVNSLGHVIALDTRSNLPYVDFASAETITGLKTIRRAGTNDGVTFREVLGFEIGDDDLYKLWIMNSQNESQLNGEVNWWFRMRENYTSIGGVNHDRLGFHRGGITVLGGRLPSSTMSTEIATFVQPETNGEPYFISTYVKRSIMVEGRGYFGRDNLTDTLFLTSDDMLYSAGTVYAAKGIRTADPNNKTTVFDHTTWFLGGAVADGTGSHTHKIRVDIDGVLYDFLAQSV